MHMACLTCYVQLSWNTSKSRSGLLQESTFSKELGNMPRLGREGGPVKSGKSLWVSAMPTCGSVGSPWLGWLTRWGHNTWWIKTEVQSFLSQPPPYCSMGLSPGGKAGRRLCLPTLLSLQWLTWPTEQLSPIQHPSSWGHALFPALCQAVRPARTKQNRVKAGTRWIIRKQCRTVYNQVEFIHSP